MDTTGVFYHFVVLPFGIASAPRIFTMVMGHCVRFLRYTGVNLLVFLDDCIFAHATCRGAVTMAQKMVAELRRFGWLIHPTKCVGVSEGVQIFTALGTLVDLASRCYLIPADKIEDIVTAGRALLQGPPTVCVRSVARFKGLVSSTWLVSGTASRIRTRELDAVIDSRPKPSRPTRWCMRATWRATVSLSADALREIEWWVLNVAGFGGAPIRPRPWDARFDSVLFSDASDTGTGAVALVTGREAASSSLIAALLAAGPPGLTRETVVRFAADGLRFFAALPADLLDASSTLRELYGVLVFLVAVGHILTGGHHRFIMDNMGCVFILGGLVPASVTGGREWGESVSGGSRVRELQRLAVRILDIQAAHGFSLLFEWRPRELNVLADYLSHMSEKRHHHYRLRRALFEELDEAWGPHSVDRFASADNRQLPRFCSHFFHPDAEWTDAFSIGWGEENNWVFPPAPLVGRAIRRLRSSRAVGTVIAPDGPWASWWHLTRHGDDWADDVVAVRRLGRPEAALELPRAFRDDFRCCNVIALRFDCRRHPLA